MSPEGIVIIVGITLPAIICGLVAVFRQTRHWPDDHCGAPEGAFHFEHRHPDASGSKLSVRVSSHRSATQDAG